MKKALLILLILFINSFSFAQEKLIIPQVKAYPKEGLKTFMKQFAEEFNANNGKAIPKSVNQINLRVKFIVEKDGSFSDIEVLDDDYKFQREIKRVFNLMPYWNAAIHEGNSVRSSFTMPIKLNYDHSKLTSENDIFFNKDQINSYVETLNSNRIETTYFDLTCNCTIIKSSTNSELTTEEFLLLSQDDKVVYSIGFKKLDLKAAINEIQKIKIEAEQQRTYVRDVEFLGYNNALNLAFYNKEGDYESQHQTLFVPTKDYLVVISLQSANKQLTNLSFAHLLKNFKLKI